MVQQDADRIPWLPFTQADAPRLARLAGEALAAFPWVRACWLHGSLVRGDRPARDLDFAVLTGFETVTLAERDAARGAIADAIGVDPAVIDLRPADAGTPRFLHNILKYGVLCCDSDREARIDFEVRANSLWCEFKPVWERSRAETLARWAAERAEADHV